MSTYESLASGTRTSGQVAAFRNRAGETIGFGHDALGRLTSKDLPGSEPDVTYGYDLLGRLTSASRTGHALGFTWDALGRVIEQSGPLGTLTSEWDLGGRRTRLTWPDGFFVTYDHLVTGETTHIRENGATSGIGVLASIAYDQLGRRTSLTLGNGASTHYDYDPVSRLDELKLELPGTADDLVSEFAYNPAGQIASNLRSNDAYSWTGHGSGTTSTSADGLNRIASWVSSLGYDAKGNITSDGSYTYTYSSENLLTSLANSAPGAIQASSTYAYDPLMRLAVIDSSNDALDASLGYDGADFVYEGLSGSRTRRYVRGPGVDEPLVAYLVTPAGTSRLWYQADERGSIVRLSNDAGTPGGIGKYDEYGAGGTGRIRYAGQYWLADGSLLYSRARIYDARLGRFLQPDPIGYGDGMNMYAYTGGDPVNASDPTGLATSDRIVCTGTRRTNGCGGGGLSSGLSGWSSAWPGGQGPTGADSLANLGIDMSGMSNAQIRNLAAGVLGLGESLAASGLPRDTPISLEYSRSGLGSVLLGEHDYSSGPNVICPAEWNCSRALIRSLYSQVRFAVPGNSSSETVVSGNTYTVRAGFIPVGTVTTYVGAAGLTVNNVTKAPHIFFDGWANRNAFQGSDGTWYSYTHGRGTNYYGGAFMAAANQMFGPGTFKGMDKALYHELHRRTH